MNRDLLTLARKSILSTFDNSVKIPPIKDEWRVKKATFVTLYYKDNLRGCIGSIKPIDTLYNDLKHNSIAAAFHDPRFKPISKKEIDDIVIEISVLTEIKEIKFTSENDLINKIIPHKMGLIIEYRSFRGTFLPQVWKHFPTVIEFYKQLKLKAGLNSDFYSKDMKIYYYEVETWKE